MRKHKVNGVPVRVLSAALALLLPLLSDYAQANTDNQHYMPPLECYDPYGRPQVRRNKWSSRPFDECSLKALS